MKKNLISVLILVLVLVDTILTAILLITVLPQSQKANELITKVCSAIDLELESGETVNTSQVPIADQEVYDIADSLTINLKKDTDGTDHYAVLTVSLTLNKTDEDYETYQPTLSTNESMIKSTINNVVSGYTYDEIRNDQQAVQDAILEELQTMFDSDFIIGVGWTATFQ
jgi:flagellar basal body-associated protein FliL